jgi:hypothetical protein
MCDENKQAGTGALVPDFSVQGFAEGGQSVAAAHAKVQNLRALKLNVCVGASYNPSTNQICFSIPIYGNACITSPISIPVGGELKACASTCGSFIPTGVQATIYLNGNSIWSGTIFGSC